LARPAKNNLALARNDYQISVRIAAAEALYGLGETETALEILAMALEDGNKMDRGQVLNVLEIMGEEARRVTKAVEVLSSKKPQNQDYDIRAANRLIQKFNENY